MDRPLSIWSIWSECGRMSERGEHMKHILRIVARSYAFPCRDSYTRENPHSTTVDGSLLIWGGGGLMQQQKSRQLFVRYSD